MELSVRVAEITIEAEAACQILPSGDEQAVTPLVGKRPQTLHEVGPIDLAGPEVPCGQAHTALTGGNGVGGFEAPVAWVELHDVSGRGVEVAPIGPSQ